MSLEPTAHTGFFKALRLLSPQPSIIVGSDQMSGQAPGQACRAASIDRPWTQRLHWKRRRAPSPLRLPDVPAQPLQVAQLRRFLPSPGAHETMSLAAVLADLRSQLLKPAEAHAQAIMGFAGTKMAAWAAQGGMIALLLLTLSPVTGLSLVLSIASIVAIVGGLSLWGMLVQRAYGRKCVETEARRHAQRQAAAEPLPFAARSLRQQAECLQELIQYLETAQRVAPYEKDHLETLQQARRIVNRINVTWGYLLTEVLTNLKMPLITVMQVAKYVVTHSTPWLWLRGNLERRGWLARTPPASSPLNSER